MNKQSIITSIQAEKNYLQQHFGVEEIALFGSYARGEEKPDSDIDILVATKTKTLSNYFSLLDYLQAKFNKKIDLVTKHKGLSQRFVTIINRILFMYNEVILAKLYTCLEHIEAVEKYFKNADNAEQFFNLNEGLQYDAVLMRLQALGENLKRIAQKHPFVIDDLMYKETDNVIRFRDYISIITNK